MYQNYVVHFKKQKLNDIYVETDDVSEGICEQCMLTGKNDM